MAFRVGQKVTLKEPPENFGNHPYGVVGPQFGEILTIRDIVDYDDGPGLRFVEIRNPPHPWSDGFRENTFNAEKFRPVVERRTDISIFEKMLTGGKQPARV